MIQKSSKIPNFDAVYIRMQAAIHDDKNILIYTASKFGILDDFCVMKKDFYKIILILSIIINPALNSENPASCLCTIALSRCVRRVPMRTLREV